MEERHLNVFQLAQRWGVVPKTLDHWRQRGCGPLFLKLGGRILYRLRDVEAYENIQLRQMTDKDRGISLAEKDTRCAISEITGNDADNAVHACQCRVGACL